jgi:epoxyqueuosine reductase QueG
MDEFGQEYIQRMKHELGVDLIGVASVEMSHSRDVKAKAAALLPGARSVIVFAKEICTEVVSLLTPSKQAGAVEASELLGVHADYLNGRLTRAAHELASLFREKGYRSLPLPAVSPTDQRFLTSLLSYKHAAQMAGLGTIGRHSLLITPEHGPRVRLACVLTEARVEPSEPRTAEDYCIDCDACIQACPAQAIQLPQSGSRYSVNGFACRSYLQAGLTCGMCMKTCDEVIAGPRHRVLA